MEEGARIQKITTKMIIGGPKRKIVSFFLGNHVWRGFWLLSTLKGAIIYVSSVPARRLVGKNEHMQKAKSKSRNKEMLEEYDFSSGVRGKYAARYPKGVNVVILEPDVAKVFRSSRSVNQVLRALSQALHLKKVSTE